MTTPISSQWPVVVSLPFERSSSRPATAGAPGCGGQPSSGSTLPRPSASRFGQVEPADGAGDVAERVRALVAVLGRVGQAPRARRRRARSRTRAACELFYGADGHRPRPARARRLHRRRSSRSRGVTWVVVKVSPSRARRSSAPGRDADATTRLDERPAATSLERRVRRGRAPRRPPRT